MSVATDAVHCWITKDEYGRFYLCVHVDEYSDLSACDVEIKVEMDESTTKYLVESGVEALRKGKE